LTACGGGTPGVAPAGVTAPVNSSAQSTTTRVSTDAVATASYCSPAVAADQAQLATDKATLAAAKQTYQSDKAALDAARAVLKADPKEEKGAERTIVTADQMQVKADRTTDAADRAVDNTEDAQLKSDQAACKAGALEITFTPASPIMLTDAAPSQNVTALVGSKLTTAAAVSTCSAEDTGTCTSSADAGSCLSGSGTTISLSLSPTVTNGTQSIALSFTTNSYAPDTATCTFTLSAVDKKGATTTADLIVTATTAALPGLTFSPSSTINFAAGFQSQAITITDAADPSNTGPFEFVGCSTVVNPVAIQPCEPVLRGRWGCAQPFLGIPEGLGISASGGSAGAVIIPTFAVSAPLSPAPALTCAIVLTDDDSPPNMGILVLTSPAQ